MLTNNFLEDKNIFLFPLISLQRTIALQWAEDRDVQFENMFDTAHVEICEVAHFWGTVSNSYNSSHIGAL